MRRTPRWGVVAVVVLLAIGLDPFPAEAVSGVGNNNCPHGGNWTASACYLGVMYGTYAAWNSNQMLLSTTLQAQGDHINHSIWAYSAPGPVGTPCQYWVEEGLTQGYHGDEATQWYYAWNNIYSGYHDSSAGYTSYNGSNHTYRLTVNGSDGSGYTQYVIVRDGSAIAYANGLGGATCISQGGLELSKYASMPDNRSQTSGYDLTPLEWQDSSLAYHTGWNTSEYWIDWPCGQGQNPPNCFNGTFYGSSHWSDNKPNS